MKHDGRLIVVWNHRQQMSHRKTSQRMRSFSGDACRSLRKLERPLLGFPQQQESGELPYLCAFRSSSLGAYGAVLGLLVAIGPGPEWISDPKPPLPHKTQAGIVLAFQHQAPKAR